MKFHFGNFILEISFWKFQNEFHKNKTMEEGHNFQVIDSNTIMYQGHLYDRRHPNTFDPANQYNTWWLDDELFASALTSLEKNSHNLMWTGNTHFNTHGYQVLQKINITRRNFTFKGKKHQRFQVNVPPIHVAMRKAELAPHSAGLEASHLCHNNFCLDVTHIVWETHPDNMKRILCKNQQVCQCGNTTKCLFQVHHK
jgi:hypothetical protein